MVGLLNMENLEGSLERTARTTHYVSMWYIPGGCDYTNAKPAVLFFNKEETAKAFAAKWSAHPELAMAGPISDYDRVRSACVNVYEKQPA